MSTLRLDKIRNFGIFAHIDAGKTTISERILYYTGRTHKIGEVHDGAAVMDWMQQEQERGITITAATTRVEWRGFDLHLIDTPGHVDFTVEVERSLRVLDGTVLVLDAVAGVQPQTETIWRQAVRYKVPILCFVNKMDRVGASFEDSLRSLETKCGARVAPLVAPLGAESSFSGVIDLVAGRVVRWEEGTLGANVVLAEVTQDEQPLLEKGREELLEILSDFDDGVAEAYLEGRWPGEEALRAVIRRLTIHCDVIPVLCGTALRNKGVQMLLDGVVDYLPSPAEVPPVEGVNPKTGAPETRKPSPDAPFAALAFKVQQDAARKLTYIRVYSGVFDGGRLLNATRDRLEKPAAILSVHADKKERVEKAYAGDILALTGLKFTTTGDTLCDPDHPVLLETIHFAEPVISVAVEPVRTQDEDKLAEALAKLVEEDPTFRVEVSPETGQTIASGMGELHLEVLLTRLKDEYNVGVHVGKPQVVYKETVVNPATARGTFDRLLGEKRHAASALVALSPNERGAGNAVVVADKVLVAWPQYADLVRASVNEAFAGGSLGYQVEDLRVEVVELEGEEGAISEMAVKVAIGQAIREASQAGGPMLLEPVMEVKVTVPEDNLGEIIGDLNARRGEVHAVESLHGAAEVTAFVALRRMFGYSTDLRSLTQGRGTFTMKFHRSDVSAE